jgi:hypothetical protein
MKSFEFFLSKIYEEKGSELEPKFFNKSEPHKNGPAPEHWQQYPIPCSVTCLQAVYQYYALVEARDNEKILVEAFVTHDNESKLKRR